jgi:hypothetical protein
MEHLSMIPTPIAVLDLISKAERSRRLVWTAGMVLKRAALVSDWKELNHSDRQRVLHSITGMLEDLAARGVLERRPIRQTIGFGEEVGFDYIGGAKHSS